MRSTTGITMRPLTLLMRPLTLLIACIAGALGAAEIAKVPLNVYVPFPYEQEPVSFDVDLPRPMPANIGLAETPYWQTEVLAGTREAATKVRVWTLHTGDQPTQRVFSVIDAPPPPSAPSALMLEPAGEHGGVPLAVIGNAAIRAKVVAGSVRFPQPVSAFAVPGPVSALAHGSAAGSFVGSSWIDTRLRVVAISAETERGMVYVESRIRYEFEGGKSLRARVRVYQCPRPYVELVEDFDLGGDARWVFSYGDWKTQRFLRVRDGGLKSEPTPIEGSDIGDNPADDFITVEGQTCLARLVVWSQFGYFRGKNETIGMYADDDSLFVGAFYIRPDRWTRAKINHVDLYLRPEVPGQPITRGVLGLQGSERRPAMEAWIIDGHREWALMAIPPRDPQAEAAKRERALADRAKKLAADKAKAADDAARAALEEAYKADIAAIAAKTWAHPAFIPKAHIQVGVWPLDRLNRLPLVWNADGSPVAIEHQAPKGAYADDGYADRMLKQIDGRGGLATFNGSEGTMRGGMIGKGRKLLAWAAANKGVKAADIDRSPLMAGAALPAYFAMDESAYPGRRAMLPWTDPEALNPFYQGMENMNFNADRYASVAVLGAGLQAAGHPEGAKILDHGREQLDMSLDRYVYPQSGCWEESHGYCGHTMKNATILARTLREMGSKDFFEDIRFAKLFGFWALAHSPRDPGFDGYRLAPPIGDHGLSLNGLVDQMRDVIPDFAKAKDPEIQRIARNLAWLLREKKAEPPAGVEPEKPDLSSRYLQGYGVAMRHTDAAERESYLIVRAEQSWGHHHQDKGSLWFWGRNVHFFGDAAWGSPPGGTYWNPYKQGPASGTQIEFVGINNWPLPCKYPGPWIADDEYKAPYDYCLARCRYPYNPALDLSASSPAALVNGYDRQVLFVKDADLLVVRDNVEATVPTIWRLHSFQVDGTNVDGARATLASPQGEVGELAIVSPAGVSLATVANHDLPSDQSNTVPNAPFGSASGTKVVKGKEQKTHDTRSLCLRWDMPRDTSATWTFQVRGKDEVAAKVEVLEPAGRVVRATLADGRVVVAMLSNQPFSWSGEGIEFQGSVGLIVTAGGARTVHAIRAATLTAK